MARTTPSASRKRSGGSPRPRGAGAARPTATRAQGTDRSGRRPAGQQPRTGQRKPTGPRPRKKRNPNRWRFYVLLAVLGLIAAAVLWFTVGRDAVASYRQGGDSAGAEASPAAQEDTGGDGAPDAEGVNQPDGQDPDAAGPGAGEPDAGEPGVSVPPTPADQDEEPDAHALANPVQCHGEALDLTIDTDGRTHDGGAPVPIRVAVTNTGAVPCLVDMGHEEMMVTITSGADEIWQSEDCPRGAGERRLLLDIGADAAHTITWPGERCGGGTAGEGTYRLAVELTATGSPAHAQAVIELR